MPKAADQRGKLLVLLQIFQRETDENHPLSVPALVSRLAANGVTAERKSLYENIETLREQGYDIELQRGRGYYLAERDFELPELKLLVDAVQSSRFITARKSAGLIEKLSRQTSVHEARTLQRQMYVAGRARSMNERVYYSIDSIYEAINAGRQITFAYFDYNVAREKIYRHDHRFYEVSPFALMRDNENYYLVAYDSTANALKHFRVDKMDQLYMTEKPREGRELFEAADPATYADRHFGMFRGKAENVLLRCQPWMAHVLIDRFGDDVIMSPEPDGSFTASVRVSVSPQFFAWLFGLEGGAVIQGPESVKEEMEKLLKKQLEMLSGQ